MKLFVAIGSDLPLSENAIFPLATLVSARDYGRALVAQWIEQEPSNLLVAGSIPAGGAFAFL